MLRTAVPRLATMLDPFADELQEDEYIQSAEKILAEVGSVTSNLQLKFALLEELVGRL